MKDSQHFVDQSGTKNKYIKESNERFSTSFSQDARRA